jgi:ribosomal protein L11 methyltransferase
MFELCLRAPEAQVELISDALMELDALSVSVEDADADTPHEQALFGEPDMPAPRPGWDHSELKALYAHSEQAREAAAILQAQDWFTNESGCRITGIQEVPDQDWVRLTQSQFQPIEISPGFWIVPSWHDTPTQAQHIIQLDPGLAFGTGSHPTTRMCLKWTAAHPPLHQRVLDYGCGSGILAIAAAKFGATDIDAVDIDVAAVQATQDNATHNQVKLRTGTPELAQGQYPLVYANILATPLKMLAPLLCQHVAPGGHLVLAGILERQAQELQTAYAPWCQLQVSDQMEGWILMTAHFPKP